jgi:hypothetical protein
LDSVAGSSSAANDQNAKSHQQQQQKMPTTIIDKTTTTSVLAHQQPQLQNELCTLPTQKSTLSFHSLSTIPMGLNFHPRILI